MTAQTWTADEIRALGARTDLVTAGSVLGIGRTVAYDLARRGEFPVKTLRLGRKYVVPVAALLRLLEVEDSQAGPRNSEAGPASPATALDSTPLQEPRHVDGRAHPTATASIQPVRV